MAREQSELQTMGIFGICKEAYKITVSWKKIFSQISMAFVLPLSILYLSEIQLFYSIPTIFGFDNPSRWIAFGILKAVYMLFYLIFSLITTSVVSYTIACIYTSKVVTIKKVISIVPKVWKRLTVTFFCGLLIVSAYTGVALGLLFLFGAVTFELGVLGQLNVNEELSPELLIFLICLSIPYFTIFVYIYVVWELASVISVLEQNYGRKALKKSMNIIKGKIWVSSAIFIMLLVCFRFAVSTFTMDVVINGKTSSMVRKFGTGILCYLLLHICFHFGFVIQTVIYFVCKSYHQEDINLLADHLDISFVPLNMDEDVQSMQEHK